MTEQARHTAGPWEFDENFEVVAPGGMTVCTVLSCYDFPCVSEEGDRTEEQVRADLDAECAANGRLIASAPEVVATGREVLAACEAYDNSEAAEGRVRTALDALREALSKAPFPAA